jgi:cell wall-associated NlpC family hydrolase
MRKWPIIFLCLLTVTGCQGVRLGEPKQQLSPKTQSQEIDKNSHLVRVEKTEYVNGNEIILHTKPISESDVKRTGNEFVINMRDTDAVHDFLQYVHPNTRAEKITVKSGDNTLLSIPAQTDRIASIPSPISDNTTPSLHSVQTPGNSLPPRGVRIDPNITPLAPINASRADKVTALRQVGESKLGMRYVWGHNEDRGQVGFDCSNYVEYVYHHALGYLFTTSSRLQYRQVGEPVPVSQMQAGDLVCFNNGGHVGIYMGNGQMIQMGGGTGKCSYLPLRPGTYWYNHLSAVKRMF